MLVDAHCHVDHYPDPFAVLEESARRGMRVVAVTNLPSYFEEGIGHLRRYPHVLPALGLHPSLAAKHSEEMAKFGRLCGTVPLIGEVGLDGSHACLPSLPAQVASLRQVLKLAGPGKTFILHSRRAENAVLEAVLDAGVRRAIFHWYSGSLATLDRILAAGFLVSLNPAMCLSKHGRQVTEHVPLESIITESDGPFAGRNGTPYVPWDVHQVVEYLAKRHGIPASEVESRLCANFERAFGGPPHAR